MITEEMKRVTSFVVPRFEWSYDLETGCLSISADGKLVGDYALHGWDIAPEEYVEDVRQIYLQGMISCQLQVNENLEKLEAEPGRS